MKKKKFLKRILILDNYDSFTYNLKHYFSSLGCDVTVVFNDELDVDLSNFSHIVISPGPGLPSDTKVLFDVLKTVDGKIPVLGVCLGMQAICEFLGGEIYNQSIVKHGVSELINTEPCALFDSIERTFEVGLYHSWAVNDFGDYVVTAKSDSDVVMAIENKDRKMYGVQFHPESIMTQNGKAILLNFLKLA